jgi:hypothetical protein
VERNENEVGFGWTFICNARRFPTVRSRGINVCDDSGQVGRAYALQVDRATTFSGRPGLPAELKHGMARALGRPGLDCCRVGPCSCGAKSCGPRVDPIMAGQIFRNTR